MSAVRDTLDSLLSDDPSLADDLEALLAVDDRQDTWTFDDVPLDSGTFGELVSRGVVEKVEGEYRLADADAVRRTLGGEPAEPSDGGPSEGSGFGVSLPSVERRLVLALGGLVLSVALFRSVFAFPSVFRDGHVVLASNDPYYYRYLVETLHSSPGMTLSSLPPTVSKGEPLFVATLWLASAVLGGSDAVVGWVLAWYPVVTAMATALLVYPLAVRVTDDRRVGLAAVAMLAVLPAHAFRTSLGFADHHAFDFFWLALTMLALYLVVTHSGTLRVRRTWGRAVLLGVAVAGQVLAWEAGPLLVVPVGVTVVALLLLDARDGRSVLPWALSLLVGLGLATVLTVGAHVLLNWHTTTVVLSPLLLLASLGLLVAVVSGAAKRDVGWRVTAGAVGAATLATLVGVRLLLPQYWREAMEELGRLGARRDIIETRSLLDADTGAWLLLFGFLLFVALAYLGWATYRVYRGDRRWTLPVCYAWSLLALTVLQIRFGGQASIALAPFAGLGFVHLASRIDVVEPPAPFRAADSDGRSVGPDGSTEEDRSVVDFAWPNRTQASYLLALFVLLAGLSVVQIPIKTSQIVIEDDTYETASWLSDYDADVEGDDYVLSEWGRNRVYNYFVSGQSQSYAFARDNYVPFMAAVGNESQWYDRIRHRIGYVVAGDQWPSRTIGNRLRANYGSKTSDAPALEHYRAVHETANGDYTVFDVVPGAVITGESQPNSTFTTSVEASVGDKTVTYEKSVDVNRFGVYETVVPYAGTYQLGDQTASVSVRNVTAGGVVSSFEGPGIAAWSFDEGEGKRAFDRSGGFHARLVNASWTDGAEGSAVSFPVDGGRVAVNRFDGPEETFTVATWIRPDRLPEKYEVLLRTGSAAPLILESSGRLSYRVPGVNDSRLVSNPLPTDRWTHVALTFDGTTKRLYVDGSLVRSQEVQDAGSVAFGNRMSIGGNYNIGGQSFDGAVDEFRVYDYALGDEEISSLAAAGAAENGS